VLAQKAGRRAVHQGVAAVVAAVPYAAADAICRIAAESNGLLVALDGIEDPRNLGAIVRTAAAAGAHGVLLGSEATVGLTPVAAKAAAGALERLPVAREPRLGRRLVELKELGFHIVALDPRGAHPWHGVSLRGRAVILAGGEGRGLRRGLLDAADARAALPLGGGVESLNVSVAVGVVLYEAVRQRANPERSEISRRRLESP
jgi:23S rRNA (guanosine2251-2'-O)-methyltransferase